MTASVDGTARIWEAPDPETVYADAWISQFRTVSNAEWAAIELAPPERAISTNMETADTTDCDRLAAHPLNPDRIATGVWLTEIDAERAVPACEAALAADPDNRRLEYQLGRALERQEDYGPALAHCQRSAESAHAMAIDALGTAHATGMGVEPDRAAAVQLWTRALDGGAFLAGAALGRALWDGDGAPEDLTAAIEVWRRGAAMGDPGSHERLAWVYELGRDGMPADLAEALYHYAVAVRLYEEARGDEDAERLRYRRGGLARLVPRSVAATAWQRALDFEPVPADSR